MLLYYHILCDFSGGSKLKMKGLTKQFISSRREDNINGLEVEKQYLNRGN